METSNGSKMLSWRLRSDGLSVQTSVSQVDVLAHRGELILSAEVKGRTAATGLDVDTAYGQLLRRMDRSEPRHRYAIVVPAAAASAAERVPSQIRQALRIDP